MAHANHADLDRVRISLALRRALAAAVAAFVVVTVVGLIVLWPSGHRHRSSVFGPPVNLVNATVNNVVSSAWGPGRCDVLFVKVTSGPDAGTSTFWRWWRSSPWSWWPWAAGGVWPRWPGWR